MSGAGGTGGTRHAVGARFTPRRIRVALGAHSHVMRQAVAVSCGKNTRCRVTVAVVLVAAPVPSIPDQYRILAPSPSSREWTDPADGRVVTGGLVHVVRFEPGWSRGPDGIWALSERARDHQARESRSGRMRIDSPVTMRSRRPKGDRPDLDPYMMAAKLTASRDITFWCTCGYLVRFTLPQPCGEACEWHGNTAVIGQEWWDAIDPDRAFNWSAVTA